MFKLMIKIFAFLFIYNYFLNIENNVIYNNTSIVLQNKKYDYCNISNNIIDYCNTSILLSNNTFNYCNNYIK